MMILLVLICQINRHMSITVAGFGPWDKYNKTLKTIYRPVQNFKLFMCLRYEHINFDNHHEYLVNCLQNVTNQEDYTCSMFKDSVVLARAMHVLLIPKLESWHFSLKY